MLCPSSLASNPSGVPSSRLTNVGMSARSILDMTKTPSLVVIGKKSPGGAFLLTNTKSSHFYSATQRTPQLYRRSRASPKTGGSPGPNTLRHRGEEYAESGGNTPIVIAAYFELYCLNRNENLSNAYERLQHGKRRHQEGRRRYTSRCPVLGCGIV